MTVEFFKKDLEYWGIDKLMMEPCCALESYPKIETCVNEKQVKKKKVENTMEQKLFKTIKYDFS